MATNLLKYFYCSAVLFTIISSNSFGQDQEPERNIWVLIIGISDYENIAPLSYADDDALLFYKYLNSFLGDKINIENTRILLNADASGGAIEKGFTWLVRNSKAGDIAYIYYSGHGGQENITIRKRGFLLGYNSFNASFISGGNFPMIYLDDMLLTLSSKNVKTYFFADACHSGKNEQENFDYLNERLGDEIGGITKILSAQGNEKSYEHEKWGGGHGAFTYYLVKGLLGEADNAPKDRIVSIRELSRYLGDSVPSTTNYKQNPRLVANDMADIISVVRDDITSSFNMGERLDINESPLIASRGIDPVSNNEENEKINRYVDQLRKYAYLDNDSQGALSILDELLKSDLDSERKSQIKDKLNVSILNYTQYMINKFMDDYHTTDTLISYVQLSNAITVISIAKPYFDMNNRDIDKLMARKRFLEGWLTHAEFHTDILVAKDLIAAADKINEATKFYDSEAPYLYYLEGVLIEHTSYFQDVDYERVERATKSAIDLAPNWSMPYNTLGHLYLQKEEFDQAIAYYKLADDRTTTDGQYLSNIGDAYAYDYNDYDSAYSYWLKAIRKDPSYLTYWYSLLDFDYKPDSLIKAAKLYVKNNPKDSVIIGAMYELLGDYYLNYVKKPDLSKVANYYYKAANVDKANQSYYYEVLADYYAQSIKLNDGLSGREKQFLESAENHLSFSVKNGGYSSYYLLTRIQSLLGVDFGYHQSWSLIKHYTDNYNYNWDKAISSLENFVSDSFELNNPLHTYYRNYYYERVWAKYNLALLYEYGLKDHEKAVFYTESCLIDIKNVGLNKFATSNSILDEYNQVAGELYQLILDDNQKSVEYFKKMIDRQNWANWKGLALAYIRLNEYEKVEKLRSTLRNETIYSEEEYWDEHWDDGYDNIDDIDLILINFLVDVAEWKMNNEVEANGYLHSLSYKELFMDVPLLYELPEFSPFRDDIDKYVKLHKKNLVRY